MGKVNIIPIPTAAIIKINDLIRENTRLEKENKDQLKQLSQSKQDLENVEKELEEKKGLLNMKVRVATYVMDYESLVTQ